MAVQQKLTGSLVDRTSRAAAWMTAQALLTKFILLASQLVLARLLLREDFGLYGLALTVYSFAALLHQAGLQEVLVKRQRSFRVWANAAFWMSLGTGLAACLITILIAPLASTFYRCDDPSELTALIAIMAIIFPIGAAGAVSRARLQIDMRFRALAFIGTIQIFLDAVLKILFAWLGYGAFSFAYAMLIVSVVHLCLCWALAPIPIHFSLQLRRWRYLLGDGVMVVAAAFLYWLIEEGDYIVLGRFEDVSVVGLYFFAFKISRHTMTLLTFQFSKVLLPALSSLSRDEEKQIKAFVRAARVVAIFAMPCCVALAGTADPVVRLVFESRWYPAIGLIQIMCLGMALRTISWPAASLLQAQGRFRTRMWLGVFSVTVFFPATILGTWLGGATGLAIAVAIFYSLIAIVDVGVAVRPAENTVSHLRSIFGAPLIAMSLASAPAVVVAYWIVPQWHLRPFAEQLTQITLFLAVAAILYGLLIRWLSPVVWRDGKERLAYLFFARGRDSSANYQSPPVDSY